MDGNANQFPALKKPNLPDPCIKLCKINLSDFDQKLTFKECINEFDFWRKLETSRVHWEIFKFVKKQILRGNIYDKDPNEDGAKHFNIESQVIKNWLNSDVVQILELDIQMWDHFYEAFEQANAVKSEWNKTVDEPKRRVFWRKDEGMDSMTFMTDTIIDADMTQLMCCFDQEEILQDIMQDFNSLKWLQRSSEGNGLLFGIQRFPWPIADRDMCMHNSSIPDLENRAIVSLARSLPVGFDYHGVKVPASTGRLVRMDFNMCFNYFQYLGPNRCRHI